MSAPDIESAERTRPRATARVLVAAADGLHDATEGGLLLADHRIDGVTCDGDAVWAVADGTDLYRIADGRAESVATLDGGRAGPVVAHRDAVFVGGDEAAVWMLGDRGLERVSSFDTAPTRAGWYTPWGGPPSVFSFAGHDTDLYASVHVGGILRTGDRGATWAPTIDLHDDVHQVAVDAASGTVWAATGASGLARSGDRGDTWTYLTDGLHATYLLAVAVSSAGVLVGASSGHAATDGAVHLFDGTAFRPAEGLPDHFDGAVGPRRIAASGDVAAVVLPDGSLFRSGDGGVSWESTGDRFRGPTEVVVAPAS